MSSFYSWSRCFLFLVVASLTTRLEKAALTVDPARSQITLSGTVAGFTLGEQKTGSLTTKVGGSIDITTAGGQIQITGASLDPEINGDWLPGLTKETATTPAPADLGGQASTFFGPVTGALRNLLVTATSSPKPLDANGQFDASSIVFLFPTNSTSVLDYNSFATGYGSKQLASTGTNQTATVGTLVENSGNQTLTIALDAVFFFRLISENDTRLRLTGQLVASGAPSTSAPTIGAVELVNGQLKITVNGASATSQLEVSNDLKTWAPVQATGTAGANGTTTFTVPASGKFQFFRVKS